MKLIELHILQSFPVSCLNRDDVGSPKSAVFGGVNRARISSQCLKRAARLFMNDIIHENRFHTVRTRLAHEALAECLSGPEKFSKEQAFEVALEALSILVDGSGAKGAKKDGRTGRTYMPAILFLSPKQREAAADEILKKKDEIIAAMKKSKEAESQKGKEGTRLQNEARKGLNKALGPVAEAIQKAGLLDAPDIALFGRMVANEASLNVEAASMFSHALSTHKTENDLDFFSAVDDVKAREGLNDIAESDGPGAAMIDSSQFNSATYYRYCAINLDLLAKNLAGIEAGELKKVVEAFLCSVIQAIPSARQNSHNAHVMPGYVLGTYREKGQPVQLINAFECPVPANGCGFMTPSIDRLAGKGDMKGELAKLEDIWGLKTDVKVAIPDVGIDQFIQTLTSHVS
jgi:CRISPR system Cascade subunit CasC